MDHKSNEIYLRKVVKTTILEQEPPNPKRDDGLCLRSVPPLLQSQKMVSLLHSYAPLYLAVKNDIGIETSLFLFT